MADSEIQTKNINDLDSKDTVENSDNLMVGNAGTNTLRRVKLSTLFDSIKSLITSWTFSALNTSDKTLTGAINEVRSASNGNITLYTNPTQFGSSASATLGDMFAALPSNSLFIYNGQSLTSPSWNLPHLYGMLHILKMNSSRADIYYYGKEKAHGDYRMFVDSEGVPTGTWLKAIFEEDVNGLVSASDFEIDTFTITGVTCDAGSSVTLDFDATKSGYKLLAAWFRGATERRLLCVDIRVRTSTSHIEVVMHVLGQSSSVTDRCEVSVQALFVKE